MERCEKIKSDISTGRYDKTFGRLYPATPAPDCRKRFEDLLDGFTGIFGDMPAVLISAPGRTEVGGNHTDHQHGNVLAAAVNLDIICAAAPNGENIIRVQSAGHAMDIIDIGDLSAREAEASGSAALIRGVAKWFSDHGTRLGGFNAYTTSDVPVGSGLSSSAAFEVVMGNVMARLFDNKKSPADIAMAGQYAENVYLGKPSGLMDQMASSVGGFVQIDFRDPKVPVIYPVTCDIADFGYNLCIVDTKGNHVDLTDEYAAIASEMCGVAHCFGKEHLREVGEAEFYSEISRIRPVTGDRAVLRAIHYFRDDRLAVESAQALKERDIERFLQNVVRSGRSSFTCLQNVSSAKNTAEQGLVLALELSQSILEGKGAWRVHGGGFAGTIQAFVPDCLLDEFCDRQNALFGPGSCHVLSVRPVGGCEVKPEED